MEEVIALEERRRNIDRIDKTIVALLAERMRQGAVAGPLPATSAERILTLIIAAIEATPAPSEI